MQLRDLKYLLNGNPWKAKCAEVTNLSRTSEASRRESFTRSQTLSYGPTKEDEEGVLKNLTIRPNLCPIKWWRYTLGKV